MLDIWANKCAYRYSGALRAAPPYSFGPSLLPMPCVVASRIPRPDNRRDT